MIWTGQIGSDGMREGNAESSLWLHGNPHSEESKAPHVCAISMGKGCNELPVEQSWSSFVSVATGNHSEEAWHLSNREFQITTTSSCQTFSPQGWNILELFKSAYDQKLIYQWSVSKYGIPQARSSACQVKYWVSDNFSQTKSKVMVVFTNNSIFFPHIYMACTSFHSSHIKVKILFWVFSWYSA